MRRTRTDSRFKPKLIDLKRRKPTGSRNFKTPARFKPPHSVSLKWHSTVIQMANRYLNASSERVAAAGQEIELPKFELPDEPQ